VGLGFVSGLAVFPYHGTAADHLRQRSVELKPREAILVGIDEETALVREPGPSWSVAGAGRVTVYTNDDVSTYAAGASGLDLP
jgi:cyanophycinase-like exopeptidase